MNIYQRLNEVRKVVKYIQKDKAVQNYKAVSHDNVVAVCRDAMVEQGIITVPEQTSGLLHPQGMKASKEGNGSVPDSMRMYEGDYLIHFVNMDNPEDRATVRIQAHALDNGDKAPGKAVTYATKAALLKILFLETGENEESRVEGNRPITSEQAKMLKTALASDAERIGKFCDHYEIDGLEELPKGLFDSALSLIKKANEKAKNNG